MGMLELDQPGFLEKKEKVQLEAFSARLLKDQKGPDLVEEEKCLTNFIRWLIPKWDDFEGIFAHDGTVAFDEFEDFVRFEWEYKGDARKVFDYLAESNGITRMRTFLALKRAYNSSLDMKRIGLSGLKQLMIAKYNSLARAWRMVFDTEDEGRVCLAKFVKACKDCGFVGDIRGAWNELADGNALRHIGLKEWDPEADMLLRAFCKVLVQRHGQLREGWHAILKHGFGGDAGRLTSKEFVDIVTGLGFSLRHAKIVLHAVDADRSQTVTQDEFLFVQHYGEGLDPPKLPGPQRDSSRPPSRNELKIEQAEMEKGKNTQKKQNINWSASAKMHHKIEKDKEKDKKEDADKEKGEQGGEKPSNPGGSSEIVVFMTKDEYTEYLRRRRTRTLTAGSPQSDKQNEHVVKLRQESRRHSASPSQPVIVAEMPFEFRFQ